MVTSSPSTSPGTDSISVSLLKTLWSTIGDYITQLFDLCLRTGHHPLPFKQAEVVMLPKTGKRDLSSPRSWRPISLLSCLGKGLKRLVAKRLSFAAITYKVLQPQQFGALPKRAATDLVSCLVHDVEQSWDKGKVASLLTLDVKGAFDTVLPGRLQARLREQGWPEEVIKWTHSFMNSRQARVRLEGTTTKMKPLTCGLLQGSPASPILFMLYIEPLFKLGSLRTRFGYADDVAILRTGSSLEESTAKLTRELASSLEWGKKNGITFDPEKCELQHFIKRKPPDTAPQIRLGRFRIIANKVTRWLGVWLDEQLSFKKHIDKWLNRANLITCHLRRLGNTQRGAPASALRYAVKGCILPTLLYGADIWWPGLAETPTGKIIPRGYKLLTTRINTAVNSALRAMLPVYKTTPTPTLNREAGIPPASILLEIARLRKARRLKALDKDHPLVIRAWGRGRTCLNKLATLLPDCNRPVLLAPS